MNALQKEIADLMACLDRDKEDDLYLKYLQEAEKRIGANASEDEINEEILVAGLKAMLRSKLDTE